MFYLYVPFHGDEHRLPEGYTELSAAKAAADERAVYGYCVCDEGGEGVYSPVGSFTASHILWHAKDVADYMRIHGYTYGDADKNPALDKHSETPERLVSCDRFCGWVLCEAGFVRHQPLTKGLPLYFSPNLEEFLVASGFTRIEDAAEVRPGDLIFEGESHHMAPALPERYRTYPRHVFINAGPAENGLFYRYDAGSDLRIQSALQARGGAAFPLCLPCPRCKGGRGRLRAHALHKSPRRPRAARCLRLLLLSAHLRPG